MSGRAIVFASVTWLGAFALAAWPSRAQAEALVEPALAVSPAVAATPSEAGSPESSPTCRPQLAGLEIRGPGAVWRLSPCMGGVESVQLTEAQFQVAARPAPASVAPWASAKFAAGPFDLVETWDPWLDPYRDALEEVQVANLQLGVKSSAGVQVKPVVDLTAYAKQDPRWAVTARAADSLELVWPDPSRVRSPLYLVKTVRLAPGTAPYQLQVDLAVWNVGAEPAQFRLGHEVSAFQDPSVSSGGIFALFAGLPDVKGAAFGLDGGATRFDIQSLQDQELADRSGQGADWLATESRYFLVATAPVAGYGPQATVTLESRADRGLVRAHLGSEPVALAAGAAGCVPRFYAESWGGAACADDLRLLGLPANEAQVLDKAALQTALNKAGGEPAALAAAVSRLQARQIARFRQHLYAGPKDLSLLEQAGHGLDQAVDFGWFGLIARPMLGVLKFSQGLTGSWPAAIFMLTLLVKLLLWPFTIKSLRSMRNMAKLKPELDRVRAELEAKAKKRGERVDPQELNRATFELYRQHQVNPLGGCLPMLLQMPVYIALYRTIMSSVELYHQPLFLWISDLTAADPYFVLPVLLGVFMFVQQKVSPQSAGDPTQQKMMLYFLPVLFSLMMLQLPSGLTFYILVNTVLGIVQTVVMNRTDVATTASGAVPGAKS